VQIVEYTLERGVQPVEFERPPKRRLSMVKAQHMGPATRVCLREPKDFLGADDQVGFGLIGVIATDSKLCEQRLNVTPVVS
jgi:hypothetical protein